MTGEHDLLDAARNGGQGAFARLVGPVPGAVSGLLPSNAQAPFRVDTERWIPGPARITTSKATDLASQKGATK